MADEHNKEDTPSPPPLEPEITDRGARKIFNFIYDVLNGRKLAANFVWDKQAGKLLEATSGKEIEVVFKVKEESVANRDTGT